MQSEIRFSNWCFLAEGREQIRTSMTTFRIKSVQFLFLSCSASSRRGKFRLPASDASQTHVAQRSSCIMR